MPCPGSVVFGGLLIAGGLTYAALLYATRPPFDARNWTGEQARAAHRRRLPGPHVRAILPLIIIAIIQILYGIR